VKAGYFLLPYAFTHKVSAKEILQGDKEFGIRSEFRSYHKLGFMENLIPSGSVCGNGGITAG
jgi:hypothetical protein